MAGAGYKLFNTGDVLTAAQVNTYLQEQVVMVFNDATARTTALSGVLAEGMVSYLKSTKVVEIYNGTAWASLDDPNAIQNTIVDAKGDLISASGNDVPARLAVGNNGETLVADSSASTGLRWQADWNVGKNKIINGDFRIWQRGTSFTAVNAYTADRFDSSFDGSGGTRTVSQQTFTPGTAPVAGYEGWYFYRYNKSVGGTGGTVDYILRQKIEDVRTFAGQTVTISFWAKANTNLTVTSVIQQNFGSGGSSAVDVGYGNHSLTTSWQRFSATYTLGSMSGKTIGTSSFVMPFLYYLNTNGTFTIDIWGVQLEAGSVATPFTTATGTLAGELAACQRYYNRYTGVGQTPVGVGSANSTTNARVQIHFPVEMRTNPSVIDSGGSWWFWDGTNLNAATSFSGYSLYSKTAILSATSSSLTQFRSYFLIAANDTTAYIGFSAEL